jgi:hypothetical protein
LNSPNRKKKGRYDGIEDADSRQPEQNLQDPIALLFLGCIGIFLPFIKHNDSFM